MSEVSDVTVQFVTKILINMADVNKENCPPHDSNCTHDNNLSCLLSESNLLAWANGVGEVLKCSDKPADHCLMNLDEELAESPASPTLSASEMYDELLLRVDLDGEASDPMEEEAVDVAAKSKRRRRKVSNWTGTFGF